MRHGGGVAGTGLEYGRRTAIILVDGSDVQRQDQQAPAAIVRAAGDRRLRGGCRIPQVGRDVHLLIDLAGAHRLQ